MAFVTNMRAFIRSVVFNIAFFGYCFFASLFFAWTFVLPRKAAFNAILYYFKGSVWVERLFLGLDYAVSGRENLPPAGTPYILAVKHYSAYETLTLPAIFGDIAIILKKELTWIPFWGWYTIKTGMIPVDRGGGAKALASLIRGAKRVIAQGRPILIFPQGTRVSATDTTAEKPYKVGIAKIAHTLDLPIVPVAINSGAFWPKHGFIKKPGIVDFQIMPMIPAGTGFSDILKQLEAAIEPTSAQLMAHPRPNPRSAFDYWPRGFGFLVKTALVLFAAWAVWWHALAYGARTWVLPQIVQSKAVTSPLPPIVTGFPGALRIDWAQVTLSSPDSATGGKVTLPMMSLRIWPLPAAPAVLEAPSGLSVEGRKPDGTVMTYTIDRARADFTLPAMWQPRAQWALRLTGVQAGAGETTLRASGGITLPLDQTIPASGQLDASIGGYRALSAVLKDNGLVTAKNMRIANGFFDAMAAAQGGGDTVRIPVKVINGVVYAGFVRVFALSPAPAPTGQSVLPPQKTRSGDWETNSLPDPASQTPVPPQQP